MYLIVFLLAGNALTAQVIKLKKEIIYVGETPTFSFIKKAMGNELYVYKLNTKEEFVKIVADNNNSESKVDDSKKIIFTQQKEWKKAVSDWDMAINIMGEGYYLLKYRGLCKSWLEDFSGACRDFNLAYKLDDFQDSQLKQWIEQNCK